MSYGPIKVSKAVLDDPFFASVRQTQRMIDQAMTDMVSPPSREELDRRQLESMSAGRAYRRTLGLTADSHGLRVAESKWENPMDWDVCGWREWLAGPHECD